MAATSVTHNQWTLQTELIQLSDAETWNKAITEWKLDYIEDLERGEDSETCLCSHYPIREVCHISNVKNGNTAIVGNICVQLFEKGTVLEGTHKIFDALSRIKKNENASANEELIKYAHDREILSEKDYNFYLDIWRKKSLSDAQQGYKTRLNQRIIRRILGQEEAPQAVDAQRGRIGADFTALKQDPKRWAALDLVGRAHTAKVISDRDRDFYKSVWEKNADLSEKQQKWMNDINGRIVSGLKA